MSTLVVRPKEIGGTFGVPDGRRYGPFQIGSDGSDAVTATLNPRASAKSREPGHTINATISNGKAYYGPSEVVGPDNPEVTICQTVFQYQPEAATPAKSTSGEVL